MTEKEIMKQLTHAMIWHLFKPTFQGSLKRIYRLNAHSLTD